MRNLLVLAGLLALAACAGCSRKQAGHSAARTIPAEPKAVRETRHARVAQRRAGTVIMVHRGASKFAPENTLDAYAAAMDHGADGCEIDIHRSVDGILCMHHDDKLGRIYKGVENLKELTYAELSKRPLRGSSPPPPPGRALPTLAAVLKLAQERTMLLHLDIKAPGLDAEIARLFNEADAWDHIVSINSYHSEELRKDPRIQQLKYKGWLHEAGKTAESRAKFLQKPEQMIFVKDDPTEAAKLLGRAAPARKD